MLRGSPWAKVALVFVTALHLTCGAAPTAPRRLADADRGIPPAGSASDRAAA